MKLGRVQDVHRTSDPGNNQIFILVLSDSDLPSLTLHTSTRSLLPISKEMTRVDLDFCEPSSANRVLQCGKPLFEQPAG